MYSAHPLAENYIWLSYRDMLPLSICVPLLTKQEHEYCIQVSAKRALQFANGRALVRQILQQQGILPTDIELTLPGEQAPVLRIKGQKWRLSISHSGQAVAVALSPAARLGVDIEQLKARNWSTLALQYPILQGVTDLNEFYQRWTSAEAYCKAAGNSIWQVLQHPLPQDLYYRHIAIDGYALCLCYCDKAAQIILVNTNN